MAWNEPGGDKKDPWGNRQQPPDLDELLSKLKEKWQRSFARRGGGSNGGGNKPTWSGGVIAAVIAVIIGIWAVFGFYQVDEKERAVVLRLGKYYATYQPGLRWNPPLIDEVIKVLVTEERQYSARGLMLTEDENIVEAPLTVQFNVANAEAFALNVKNPVLSLQHATDSAIRHVVGSTKLDDVISIGREQVAVEVKLRLQEYLDLYGAGIQVININIQETRPPQEVKAAYDDVIKAREDQERLINEAEAYRNGIIPEARGNAQRILEESMAYREKVIVEAKGEAKRFEQVLSAYQTAPQVTRERLYIDAIETVMDNTSKVLLDAEGGNNLLYLPLDQLMQSTSQKPSAAVDSKTMDDIADQVIDKLRAQQQQANRRQGGAR